MHLFIVTIDGVIIIIDVVLKIKINKIHKLNTVQLQIIVSQQMSNQIQS